MAASGPQNIIARRVTNDLIAFSGETTIPRYKKFFLVQKLAESRHFVNRMRDEMKFMIACWLPRMLSAVKRVIAEALADIETLEMDVEILDGENNGD
ncbi:hypothetical protein Tco_0882215 [Tanacetum coccineum]